MPDSGVLATPLTPFQPPPHICLNFSLQFFAAAAALLSQVGNLNWIGLTAMAVQSTEGNPSGPC